jgi:hypothetical protein
MARSQRTSARVQLRAFQQARKDIPGSGFKDDLQFLQSKDLDMSVRLGALLAFDALLLTAALNPISASPGAPLSLDAPTQPLFVILVGLCVAVLSVAAFFCVRGILVGEEFDLKGMDDNQDILVQRLLAAYCSSIDAQMRMIRMASMTTIVGGIMAALISFAIMMAKMAA